MQITFHSQAASVPEFRHELVAELKRRLELARGDQLRAVTQRDSARHGARATELQSLIDFYETLRLLGEKH